MTVREIRKIEKSDSEWTYDYMYSLVRQMVANKRNLRALDNMSLDDMKIRLTFSGKNSWHHCTRVIGTKVYVNKQLANYAEEKGI